MGQINGFGDRRRISQKKQQNQELDSMRNLFKVDVFWSVQIRSNELTERELCHSNSGFKVLIRNKRKDDGPLEF